MAESRASLPLLEIFLTEKLMKSHHFLILISAALLPSSGCKKETKESANRSQVGVTIRKKDTAPARLDEVESITNRAHKLIAANPASSRKELIALVRDLSAKDPIRALEIITKLPEDFATWYMFPLHQSLVERDPSGCARWLSEYKPKGRSGKTLASGIFSALAAKSPDLAFSSLVQEDGTIAQSVLDGGINQWVQNADLDTVIGEIKGRLSGAQFESAISTAIAASAIHDPLGSYDAALRLEPGLRQKVLPDVFGWWVLKEGHSAVIGPLSESSPAVIQAVISKNKFIETIASESPDSAIALLAKIPLTASVSASFDSAAKGIAIADPEKALNWVKSLPAGNVAQSALRSTFEGWAQKAPDSAKDAALGMEGDDRRSALRGVGLHMGQASIESGVTMLWTLDKGDWEPFLAGVSDGVQRTNPENVLRLWSDPRLDEEVRSSSISQASISRALTQIAIKDSSKALRLVAGLDSAQVPYAVGGVVAGWGRSDPEAVSRWLVEMPLGEGRTRGIQELIKIIEPADPKSAAQWRALLSEE